MKRGRDIMPTIDLGARRLACVERGTGPRVVLVHGSNSDLRTWTPVLEPLAARFHVASYSRRYHWPNEGIAEGADYAMSEQLDDLEALVSARGPAHLVGHSYGGFLCLLLAMRRPSWVRSLTLAEPPVLTLFTSAQPRMPELLRLMWTRPRTALAIARLGARGFGPATAALRAGDRERALRCVGTAVLGKRWFEGLTDERLDQARSNFIPAELLGTGFLPLDPTALRRIACPTLLLTGACSPKLFHRLTDRLSEIIRQADRVNVAKASHLSHEDNPSAWSGTVLGFLDRVESKEKAPSMQQTTPRREGATPRGSAARSSLVT
jgi:pimeloyl-ACP methyl ester carboxylesterase